MCAGAPDEERARFLAADARELDLLHDGHLLDRGVEAALDLRVVDRFFVFLREQSRDVALGDFDLCCSGARVGDARDLCLTFAVNDDQFGVQTTAELKRGGAAIEVTNANRVQVTA